MLLLDDHPRQGGWGIEEGGRGGGGSQHYSTDTRGPTDTVQSTVYILSIVTAGN